MIECYQFRYYFAESQKMACYLKREALLVKNILNWLWNDSWTYYVVCNVIEREIEKEKVQMKPSYSTFKNIELCQRILNASKNIFEL